MKKGTRDEAAARPTSGERLTIEERSLWRAVHRARRRFARVDRAQEDVLTVREAACLVGVSVDTLVTIIDRGWLVRVTDPPPWAPKVRAHLVRVADVDRLARQWDLRGAPPEFAGDWAKRKPRPAEAGIIITRVEEIDRALAEFGRRTTEAAIEERRTATPGDAAALLGVTGRSVRKMCEHGKLAERETTTDVVAGRGRTIDRATLTRLSTMRTGRRSRRPGRC